MDRLLELQTFARVVELGGFTKAGDSLHLSKTTVSDLVQSPGNANDAQNTALATATHAAQVVRTKLYDRGIKRARFVVLRETTIPAVLLEGGFLSNT